MKICIIGTGYVGLVSGACLAENGNNVVCVDIDSTKISKLKNGQLPIFEPGLEPLIKQNIKENRLSFTTHLKEGIENAAVCFIAVGTPPNEDGSADLKHVLDVVNQICEVASGPLVLGTKSTVPVGTGDHIEAILKEKLKFPYVVFSNPEFLKEGDAVNDFMKPDRIVIGLNDQNHIPLFKELYEPFMRQKDRLIVMNRKSAELTKYAANAMLATRISFMNEMANLCEKVGADIKSVRYGIGSDPRIGPSFLFPSMGFGGSCFPKDVRALLNTAELNEVELKVVKSVHVANEAQKKVIFQKIEKHFGGFNKLKNLQFALWGLSFKAKTDDIRESASLFLIDLLLKAKAKVVVYDPEALENAKNIYKNNLVYKNNSYDVLKNSDALIIATDWNEFRSPDLNRIKTDLKNPVIFDGRNILNQNYVKDVGFTYYGIGY